MRTRRGLLLTAGGLASLAAIGVLRGDAAAPVRGPFGQHWQGLEARRMAAGVAAMAEPSADIHEHMQLRLWVDGAPMKVPSGIGIDPTRDQVGMAALHTHSDDGKLHNEGQANARLGQLFAVWGVPFGEGRLGPYRDHAGKKVQMWVDGRPSDAWGSLPLEEGQAIDVAYGRPRSGPPAGG